MTIFSPHWNVKSDKTKICKTQENGEKSAMVPRSFVYSIMAIIGLLQFVLITAICSAAYFFLIVPRLNDLNITSVHVQTWMEDRVAGKFWMRLNTVEHSL